MRRSLFLAIFFCLGLTTISLAQTKPKSKSPVQQPEENSATKQLSTDSASFAANDSNQAFGASANRLYITDLVVRALNQRAAGSKVSVGSSGVVGMPHGSYGFANGKILLRPTTAPSSGTAYGSGSVGTGTSINGLGTGENLPGVNGKNPYAGSSLWGTKPPPGQSFRTDTTKKQ